MSLEIKNLIINVKVEQENKNNESSKSLKEDVLRECRQMIEDSVRWDKER
ncbi:DUF5908 family protein [Fibrobacter sp.]